MISFRNRMILHQDLQEDHNPGDTVKTKANHEIERILQKEELTNRDMVKLSRLMEKESVKSHSDSASKSLEIKDNTVKIVQKDARKERQRLLGRSIRPIPLSAY